MSLRYIIGRGGTGKSQHCFASIISLLKEKPLGEEILFLLPRQATFNAQRLLACGGELNGFCGVRVESFDELAAELMAECGGKAIPQVSALGRQMILGHLLGKNKDRLKYFSKVGMYPSLAAGPGRALEASDRCVSDLERRMLARLAKRAKHVEITLLLDPASAVLANPETIPDEGNLFHRTEWTYRRLRKALAEEGVAVEEPIVLTKQARAKVASL